MNGSETPIRSLQFLISIVIVVLLISDSASAADDHKKGSSVALEVLLVLLGVAAVVGFCVFLFRIWQKKKREEQHARLLKLFEDDDELEVELGIRD